MEHGVHVMDQQLATSRSLNVTDNGAAEYHESTSEVWQEISVKLSCSINSKYKKILWNISPGYT